MFYRTSGIPRLTFNSNGEELTKYSNRHEKSGMTCWRQYAELGKNNTVLWYEKNILWWWGMASSGMLWRVALVRTDVSEELSASFIRVTGIGELGTALAVTSTQLFLRSVRRLLVTASAVPSSPILVILMKDVLSSSETLVLTRAARRNIPEDAILHSHRRENLESYIA
jgi:hypothetical protein